MSSTESTRKVIEYDDHHVRLFTLASVFWGIIGMTVGVLTYATSYSYHEGTWVLWVILGGVVGAAGGCTMTLGPAIAADAIDSDELETGQRREGVFMGVWSFVDKAAIGLAIFIGMQGLDYVGYVPNQDQTEGVISGMKFLYCVLPAILNGVALLAFQRFPITREVHDGIREQLAARRNAADRDGTPARASGIEE
jgi:GPH family glycoside/pentoside/hexuronide:cation symporter